MFVALDQTFAAFAHVSRPYIQETIEKSPPTLDTVNAGLPRINPFLHDTARFFTALRPGAKALAETSPIIAESLHAGVPALNASPAINNQLLPTAEALLAFQKAEGVMTGLDLLTSLNQNLEAPLRFIVPAQTTCNYFSLTFKQIAISSSLGNKYGRWLNFISFPPPEGPNSESGQAAEPANGGSSEPENHLHYNPLPNTGAPGQTRGCEAGNEEYVRGKTVIGEAPHTYSTETEGIAAKETEKSGEGGEEE
jgi:hypothetical protein